MRIYHKAVLEKNTLGPNLRYILYMQGCRFACKGCISPEMQPLDGGEEIDVEVLAEEINQSEAEGLTISGGEPFQQPEELLNLLKLIKNKTIWVYTGYSYEMLIAKGSVYKKILKLIDVIVDGQFELENYDGKTLFRGSTNQRIIHLSDRISKEEYEGLKNKVQISIQEGQVTFIGIPPSQDFFSRIKEIVKTKGLNLDFKGGGEHA